MDKHNYKKIIEPIDKDLLISELCMKRFVRKTNYGSNEIYILNHHNAPNVLKEIGRLRELSFRMAGGGTGKESDIDDYDIAENPYQQLIVWEPNRKEIIGGYRFLIGNNIPKDKDGNIKMATTGLFDLSQKFIDDYLPYTIELGRSFVRHEYQASTVGRKGMFSLDNLWDGLGALILDNPTVKYFLGKVTMYTSFNGYARDLILFFMNKYFKDTENLVFPKEAILIDTDKKILGNIFSGEDYKSDYKILSKEVRAKNEVIPPLFNSYMNLSPNMKVFGTSINNKFGAVEETGILITIKDIYDSKKHRHVSTYKMKLT
ncbi:MAG: GNAT family N-acetyltransferase [Bacteroidales bacterium]|nr:GNAT family N-acetyltransferase [Bacteroidales bacterium]MBN2756840.1 GNAT family N-acetyltransferase [Bacteroidales bacterium]